MRLDHKLTIDQIAERLDISRTHPFAWEGDLGIPRFRSDSEAQEAGSEVSRDRLQLMRDVAYSAGVLQYPDLVKEPTFRDFVCTYIAEGLTSEADVVSICSTSPAVLRLSKRWIVEFTTGTVGFEIGHEAHQDFEGLRDFWGGELGVDPVMIRSQPRSNRSVASSRNKHRPLGDFQINSHDVLFRARLESWVDLMRAEWS